MQHVYRCVASQWQKYTLNRFVFRFISTFVSNIERDIISIWDACEVIAVGFCSLLCKTTLLTLFIPGTEPFAACFVVALWWCKLCTALEFRGMHFRSLTSWKKPAKNPFVNEITNYYIDYFCISILFPFFDCCTIFCGNNFHPFFVRGKIAVTKENCFILFYLDIFHHIKISYEIPFRVDFSFCCSHSDVLNYLCTAYLSEEKNKW